MEQLLGDEVFESKEQVNQRLEWLRSSGQLQRQLEQDSSDPVEQARRLVARAFQEHNSSFVEQALALDPGCTDALLFALDFNSAACTPEFRAVVAAARERLGEPYFAEHQGGFWTQTRSRAFMRAQQALALNLFWTRHFEEAVPELEQLLALDRQDRLAAREPLLVAHLKLQQPDQVRALIARFPREESALWNWAIFLLECLYGTNVSREDALANAARVNRHVMNFLLAGGKYKPRDSSNFALGGPDEGYVAASVLTLVVSDNPKGTLGWFVEHLQALDQSGKL